MFKIRIRETLIRKNNLIHILFVVIHITNQIKFFFSFYLDAGEKSKLFFSYTSLACRPIISEMSKEIQHLRKRENQNFHTSKEKCFKNMNGKGVLVKEVFTYPEPNTKSKTVKCFILILDWCRSIIRVDKPRESRPLESRSTNQRPGFQVSSLHKKCLPFPFLRCFQCTVAATRWGCNKNTAHPSWLIKVHSRPPYANNSD